MANWRRSCALLGLLGALSLLGACSSQQEVSLSALHYFQRGNAAYEAEDYERAIKDYKAALDLDDAAPDIWYNLGLAYYRIGAFDDSVGAYQHAIKLDPAFGDAHLNLALAYDKLYNAAAANLHYNRYRTLMSGNQQKSLTPPLPTAQATKSGEDSGFQRVAPLGASGAAGGSPQGGAAGASAANAAGAGRAPQPATFSPPGGARRATSLLVPQTARPGAVPPPEGLPGTPATGPNPFEGNSKWWTQDTAGRRQ